MYCSPNFVKLNLFDVSPFKLTYYFCSSLYLKVIPNSVSRDDTDTCLGGRFPSWGTTVPKVFLAESKYFSSRISHSSALIKESILV